MHVSLAQTMPLHGITSPPIRTSHEHPPLITGSDLTPLLSAHNNTNSQPPNKINTSTSHLTATAASPITDIASIRVSSFFGLTSQRTITSTVAPLRPRTPRTSRSLRSLCTPGVEMEDTRCLRAEHGRTTSARIRMDSANYGRHRHEDGTSFLLHSRRRKKVDRSRRVCAHALIRLILTCWMIASLLIRSASRAPCVRMETTVCRARGRRVVPTSMSGVNRPLTANGHVHAPHEHSA